MTDDSLVGWWPMMDEDPDGSRPVPTTDQFDGFDGQDDLIGWDGEISNVQVYNRKLSAEERNEQFEQSSRSEINEAVKLANQSYGKLTDLDTVDEDLQHIATVLGQSESTYETVKAEFSSPPELVDPERYEAWGLEADEEAARSLLRRIYIEIEMRQQDGYDVDQLILGLPQYRTLEAWSRFHRDESADELLEGLEVVVVPGPAIHPVIPNEHLLTEHLRDQ